MKLTAFNQTGYESNLLYVLLPPAFMKVPAYYPMVVFDTFAHSVFRLKLRFRTYISRADKLKPRLALLPMNKAYETIYPEELQLLGVVTWFFNSARAGGNHGHVRTG